jgi:hypothetical protein
MTREELATEILGLNESIGRLLDKLGQMPETTRVVRVTTLLEVAYENLRSARAATEFGYTLEQYIEGEVPGRE